MKKPKTTSQLKKEADRVFSIFIRLKYSNPDGYTTCYTCGKYGHYKEFQCGHFIPRHCLILRYDERNVRVQCVGCNVWGRGRVADFGYNLEDETPGITTELFKESQKIVKDFPYQEIINKYGKHLLHQTTGQG